MDYTRFPISEMHLGKFPDSLKFQSWKVNFNTAVCAKSSFSHITALDQRSSDSKVNRRSYDIAIDYRAKQFPDYDMRDAMIASVLKKLLNTQTHFRKRAMVEEQRDQKDDRFLRGRQIAYMIYEHFRATGACEAVQGLSDLFKKRSQNVDVQDFDARWDHALLSVSEMPSGVILEGIVQVKNGKILFNFRLCWLCMIKKRRAKPGAELSTIEDSCKTSHSSDDENSKLQSPERCCGKGSSHQRVKSSRAPGNSGKGQRRKGRSSSAASHSKAKQTDGEWQKSSQGSGSKEESSSDKSEIPRRFKFCKITSCKFWHPPVCLKYRSEKWGVHCDKCNFRHVEAEGKPSQKVKERWCKWINWRSLCNWVVCLEILIRENLFYVNKGDWDRNTPSNCRGPLGTNVKIPERNGPSRGIIQKCAPHERNPCAPKFEERTQGRNLAPRKMRGLGENVSKLKQYRKNNVLFSYWSQGNAGAHFKHSWGMRICGGLRSIKHMLSRKDLNSSELDTVRVSTNPTTVFTANGEVQTNEEATVYVYHVHLFVTVHILEDTLAVLSFKLCEEHGHSYEWVSGQKPHSTQNGRQIQWNTENFGSRLLVPGVSTGSSSSTCKYISCIVIAGHDRRHFVKSSNNTTFEVQAFRHRGNRSRDPSKKKHN